MIDRGDKPMRNDEVVARYECWDCGKLWLDPDIWACIICGGRVKLKTTPPIIRKHIAR